jgi:hypothetical protein
MFLRGCFFSFLLISLQTATFATIALPSMGRASAVSSAGRQVGASFGVALLATILTNRLVFHGGALEPGGETASTFAAFDDAFIIAALITAVGVLAAALLVSDKEAAPSMRPRTLVTEESEGVPAAAGH